MVDETIDPMYYKYIEDCRIKVQIWFNKKSPTAGLFLKHFGCHPLFLLERNSDTLESGLRCQKPIHCIAPKSNFTLLAVIFRHNNTFHIFWGLDLSKKWTTFKALTICMNFFFIFIQFYNWSHKLKLFLTAKSEEQS